MTEAFLQFISTKIAAKFISATRLEPSQHTKHPVIFLGVDINGVGYFLHNHYHYGKAHITTQKEFVKGMPLHIYNEKCSNTPLKVIEIGLNEILRGESYKPITYNCQTYTNTACHNKRKSTDAEKWVGGVLLGGFALLVLGAAFGGGKGK